MTLDIDGTRRSTRALLVVIGNSRRYGGGVELTSQARIDDGLLDICIFRGVNLLHSAWYLVKILLGQHLKDPGVSYFRTPRVRIDADPPQPVHVDGDLIGWTPVAFGVKSRAMRVIIPSGTPAHIFASEGEDELLG
jgi:diacylglycerol kinase family enzyme